MQKLAIIGLGYVGLPLAVAFGEKRPVVGFDINAKRIAEPASFTRVLIERSEGTDWWHRLSGSASSVRMAVE
jgi:UDP-N-acetyl-D-mannosaminuronate dehydrogenase